ncbi:PREDICTED: peroxiredoxin-2E, chloroplastic [Brassica oleracea var. oleracea]|uniref:Glutaredoxin-dependent peroxiredoxin n=1 Tax=Brassica oleracea var. oleracea TaxID=109376 RepID=A0A0D3DSN3_BRAOL|nr:PREDICTED: peroxiredoxin-2E, chloroplastic [Brassica oleracea var. oleracea]
MATSLSVSRLISSSAISVAKPLLSPTSAFTAPISFSRSLAPNLSLKPHPRRASISAVRSFSTTTISASISVGDKLPDSTLSYLDPATNDVKTVTVSSLTAGKKTILFAVPGAFTPTCSQKHVPGFVSKAGELRSKGVDVIACVSVNDAFVMEAWRKDLGISDEVMLLSDGNGEFTGKLGVELDLRDKPVGLGVRSRRYAILAEDGVVKVLNLEEGGAFTYSSAEDMLKAL